MDSGGSNQICELCYSEISVIRLQKYKEKTTMQINSNNKVLLLYFQFTANIAAVLFGGGPQPLLYRKDTSYNANT